MAYLPGYCLKLGQFSISLSLVEVGIFVVYENIYQLDGRGA